MRKLSVFFTVALAMLLTVALAAPASAVDSWWDQYANKTTNQVQYKYGIDYHKLPSSPINGAPVTGTGPTTPVSPTVNPSATGPSSYLQQYQNRVTSPVNQPLTGKIIEPGKTLVRAPSTYATAAKFALNTVPGWSRLVGGIGVGMGGATLAPGNWRDIALNQGVPASCADNVKTCTRTDLDKMLAINSCGHLSGAQSCDSIGAIGYSGETAANQWFKDSVLAPLDELWAKLTGQATDMTPSDRHVELATRGCYREFGFEPGTGSGGTIHVRGIIDKARPTAQGPTQTYWDNSCKPSVMETISGVSATVAAECMDPATGAFQNPSNGVPYGRTESLAAMFPSQVATKLCNTSFNGSIPSTVVLYRVRIWNHITQAQLDGNASIYALAKYMEWVNPDPLLNSIEDTTLSTSWDCKDFLGGIKTYTRTVKKTAAMVAPTCPLGSELQSHKITASEPGGGTKTIDQGAAVPANVAKYPDCSAVGCTLQVAIDGVLCTAGTAACHNWPAINQVTPSRVQCKYGTYTAPTSDCVALSNAYKSESGVVFDPRAQTWVAIDTYGNPIAPNPEPWNPTNPNPVPGTPPGTATPTTPGTGTPGFPGSGTSPSDNCVSPSWSWNPVDWVKSPVICALQDAFVPKTDITARIDILSGLTVTHPPFSWFTPVFTGPSGGGCPNWVVTVPGLGSKNVVCDSSFTAAIVGARGPMFGLVAAAMVWPLIRSLWYAAIPILRVTPSGR